MVARSVNGEAGLWVGFHQRRVNWLLMDRSRFSPAVGGKTWLIWLSITVGALSLAGPAIIARLINRPLKQLSFAASRVRDGDFDASHLDEKAVTSEIREVNIGFNRMAQSSPSWSRTAPDAGRHLARPAHRLARACAWKPR